MIPKEKFNDLPVSDKGDILFKHAKYIGLRIFHNQRINLYLYNDYFIELWYSPGSNSISKIEVLENEKTLDLYINQMNNGENK